MNEKIIANQLNEKIDPQTPYLQKVGLMKNNEQVAAELSRNLEPDTAAKLGLWSTTEEMIEYLVRIPLETGDLVNLVLGEIPNSRLSEEPLVVEALGYHRSLEELEGHSLPREGMWVPAELDQILPTHPEVGRALLQKAQRYSVTNQLNSPQTALQARVVVNGAQLVLDIDGFSWEWLRAVCSTEWFVNIENLPKTNEQY